MATENPNLPAPEERVSDAAEDVQTVTSEVTSEVPETEASAAAEAEPVVETPAAEEPETEKSVADPHIVHHPAVGVVVGVEDQRRRPRLVGDARVGLLMKLLSLQVATQRPVTLSS